MKYKIADRERQTGKINDQNKVHKFFVVRTYTLYPVYKYHSITCSSFNLLFYDSSFVHITHTQTVIVLPEYTSTYAEKYIALTLPFFTTIPALIPIEFLDALIPLDLQYLE